MTTFTHNIAPGLAGQFEPGAARQHSTNAVSPVLALAQDVQNRMRGMSSGAIAMIGADALARLQGALAAAQAAYETAQSPSQSAANGGFAGYSINALMDATATRDPVRQRFADALPSDD